MGVDNLRDFAASTDVLAVANAADWAITSAGSQTLTLTHARGETIRFRDVATGALTIDALI